MVYTEVQAKGKNKYYYRTKSKREKGKVRKIRLYLGANLPKKDLSKKEKEADKKLDVLNSLLNEKERKLLENIKKDYKKRGKKEFKLKYESFISKFTYNTNAIEGNTLTLQETSAILFDNITPKGKSPREISEAINHKKAFDYMLGYKGNITKDFICKLQEIITLNTLKKDLEGQSGVYRKYQVYIRGTDFIPPKPEKVEKEMKKLLRWYNKNKNLHPVILTAYFHSAFELIHPFVDGNGRTGRLLINFILHKNKYPMINIPVRERLDYYNSLEEARKGDLKTVVRLIMDKLMSTIDSI